MAESVSRAEPRGSRPPGDRQPGPAVAIRGLRVRAGGRAILKDVEADFPAGGTTLIVGPSGAGKSVLLRLLAGLITSRTTGFEVEGRVRIGERDLLADGVRPRAQRVSPA